MSSTLLPPPPGHDPSLARQNGAAIVPVLVSDAGEHTVLRFLEFSSHSPAPWTFSPVASITTSTGPPRAWVRANAAASTRPGLHRANVV